MKQHNILIVAGCASFILFLLLFPSARILATIGNARGVQFSGLSGTFWHGGARTIRWHSLSLGRTGWNITPMALLTGRLSGDIHAELPGGFANGHLVLKAGGGLSITHLEVAAAIQPFAAALGLPAMSGDLSSRFSRLEVADGWLRRATGAVSVDHYLLLPGGGSRAPVTAGFEVVFDTDRVGDDGTLHAKVHDLDGPFAIDATLILSPPANYVLKGRVTGRPGAPASLVSGLKLLGPASTRGGYEFSLAGSL